MFTVFANSDDTKEELIEFLIKLVEKFLKTSDLVKNIPK